MNGQSKSHFTSIRLLTVGALGLLAFAIWAATHAPRHNAANRNAALREARVDFHGAGRPATVTTPAPSEPTENNFYPASSTKVKRPSRTPSADALNPANRTKGDADDATSDNDAAE